MLVVNTSHFVKFSCTSPDRLSKQILLNNDGQTSLDERLDILE